MPFEFLDVAEVAFEKISHFVEPVEHQYEMAEHLKHQVGHEKHHLKDPAVKSYSCGAKAKQGQKTPIKYKIQNKVNDVKTYAKASKHVIKQTTASGLAKGATEMVLGIKTSIFALAHGHPGAFFVGHQFPSLIKNSGKAVGEIVKIAQNAPKNIAKAAKAFAKDTKETGLKTAVGNLGTKVRKNALETIKDLKNFSKAVGADLINDFGTKPPIGCFVSGGKAAANKYKEALKENNGNKLDAMYKASGAFLKTSEKVLVDGFLHHGPLKYIKSGFKAINNSIQKMANKNKDVNNTNNQKPLTKQDMHLLQARGRSFC